MSDRDELAAVRTALDKMGATLAGQLPPHIPPARFVSCVLTAVQKQPKLLSANRESLYIACKEAAEDGLLPDGREGAIVPRWDKRLRQEVCAWQPMVAGLVKLAWQCGGIAALHADVAYEGERFEVHGGTAPQIVHLYDLARRGNGGTLDGVQAVYAVAKLASAQTMQAVLTPGEVEKIRAVSKAEKGPWVDWPVAMAQVRAVRRLCKLLPLSSDRDADMRMRRASERGDIIDGVAEDTTGQPAISAPEGGKLDRLEQALDVGPAIDLAPHLEPSPATPAHADSPAEPSWVDQMPDPAPEPPDDVRRESIRFRSKLREIMTLDDLVAFTRTPRVVEYRAWLRETWPSLDAAVQDAEATRLEALRTMLNQENAA